MKKLQEMRNKLKNKKGFTMVEIIVVLVILGILIAVALPSMVGFIDEAKGKSMSADARVGFVAAQSVVSQMYAVDGEFPTDADSDAIVKHDTFKTMIAGVENYDGGDDVPFKDVKIGDSGQVTGITYVGKTHTITIENGATTIEKK